jgi:hypothetical protein
MENNWKAKAIELLVEAAKSQWTNEAKSLVDIDAIVDAQVTDPNNIALINSVNVLLKFGDMVFEATKKECADNIKIGEKDKEFNEILCYYEFPYLLNNGNELIIDKESILNINKPNL